MAEEKNEGKVCPGDCTLCGIQQRVYCSAYLGRMIYTELGSISERLSRLENIKAAEQELLTPMPEEHKVGSGAEQ